ncbi:hypothetical protein AV530_017494 [Patagioenas fasciata monilis]|uniref:Uncharacterized protein n=1 Tax=Patagioenas fasciata monilis TaxID=372326 RepID=A0A1V4JGW1_PATFA|nr:hypothetical protein AV530_017494 [Patagioenas fasciata monilis]
MARMRYLRTAVSGFYLWEAAVLLRLEAVRFFHLFAGKKGDLVSIGRLTGKSKDFESLAFFEEASGRDSGKEHVQEHCNTETEKLLMRKTE